MGAVDQSRQIPAAIAKRRCAVWVKAPCAVRSPGRSRSSWPFRGRLTIRSIGAPREVDVAVGEVGSPTRTSTGTTHFKESLI